MRVRVRVRVYSVVYARVRVLARCTRVHPSSLLACTADAVESRDDWHIYYRPALLKLGTVHVFGRDDYI